MAKAAGFDIDVQTIPHDTYLANVWMKGQFYIGYWACSRPRTRPSPCSSQRRRLRDTPEQQRSTRLAAKGRATIDDAERPDYAQAAADDDPRRAEASSRSSGRAHSHRSHVKNWVGHPLSRYFFVENVWLDKA